MRDVAGHVVQLLMNVAEEDGDVVIRRQQVDDLLAVGGGPVPLGLQIDRAGARRRRWAPRRRACERSLRSQASCSSPTGHRIGDVVERDEVDALMIERLVQIAEEFLVGRAGVRTGVVLAGHELHQRHVSPRRSP